MAFGWAGAAGGVQNALDTQRKLDADLAAQLADRYYKQQIAEQQRAQNERLIQQADLDRQRFGLEQQRFQSQQQAAQAEAAQAAQQRQALEEAATLASQKSPLVGALVRAGKASARDVLDDPQAEIQREIEKARMVGDIQRENQLRVIAARGAEDRRTVAARQSAVTAGARATGGAAPVKVSALPAAQKEDLITMGTIYDMANQARAQGDKIGWKGVGGMGTGSIAQFAAKNLGIGTESEQKLRNTLGNITATIAKLRGGTSFTPNEQRLLDTYTPNINDGDSVIKAKLASLQEFIKTKRENTLKVAGGDLSLNEGGPQLGERRMINGELGEWDGQGWVAVGGQ